LSVDVLLYCDLSCPFVSCIGTFQRKSVLYILS
jgi:hypothetical protein